MNGDTLRTLQAIDWDFALPRTGYVAPPHWYPGTFVPALSNALIEALTQPGSSVFDPYCGIGTTGWSAIRTGRSCQLADANPVALLTAYSTTSLLALARNNLDLAKAALGSLGRMVGRNEDLFVGAPTQETHRLDERISDLCAPSPQELMPALIIRNPNLYALRPWMESQTLAEIEVLIAKLAECQSAYLKVLGTCMLSAIARSVSSQHASWGHIADNVKPRKFVYQNVELAAGRWLRRAMSFVAQPMLQRDRNRVIIRSQVFARDWSQEAAQGAGSADLLLTSPPYADAIDYTLAQRLSLYLLGFDESEISSLVAREIGARRKRSKTTSRTDWAVELANALKTQVTWLKPRASICLVLPHKDSGRSGAEKDLRAALAQLGWRLFFETDRSIHQSHTRQSWTSIHKETILVFARDS